MGQAVYPGCPICAGASVPVFMAGEHRMYRCRACRTAFVSPVPGGEALSRFYANYHLAEAEGGWYDEVEHRMQADFAAKIAMVAAAGGAGGPGRLLDVGCGKGHFVKACVGRGIDAEGVDLSETGVRFAQEKLGVRAVQGSLSELKGRLGLFDSVTFWATIEHLPDPIGMLRDIRDVLKPGGRLLLDTGIGDDWLDRLLPGRVQWYDPPQHLFVFSEPGMRAALEKAGLRLRSLDPCFERSGARRLARKARNAAVAVTMRGMWLLARLPREGFGFTRVPVGNLMSVVAEREAD